MDSLDVYLETPVNDESYFSVRGLPEQIGYGKHFFTLTYKDPPNSPLLATNSTIVFEFVDANSKSYIIGKPKKAKDKAKK